MLCFCPIGMMLNWGFHCILLWGMALDFLPRPPCVQPLILHTWNTFTKPQLFIRQSLPAILIPATGRSSPVLTTLTLNLRFSGKETDHIHSNTIFLSVRPTKQERKKNGGERFFQKGKRGMRGGGGLEIIYDWQRTFYHSWRSCWRVQELAYQTLSRSTSSIPKHFVCFLGGQLSL